MSKRKKKLLLASAVFAAGMFAASCGGGGGGTTSTTPPPPPPPAPNLVGNALVGAIKGFTTPGTLIGYYVADIYDDGTAQYTEIPTPFDVMLDYVHEFSNGNVLLTTVVNNPAPPPPYMPTNMLYFYDHSTGSITPISNCVDYATGATVGAGTTLTNTVGLPNFYIDDVGGDIDFIVTSSGQCIALSASVGATDTASERLLYAGNNYLVIGDGTAAESVYIIDVNGTVTLLDGVATPDGAIPDLTININPFPAPAIVYDKVPGTDIILLGANGANAIMYMIRSNGTPVRLVNEENVIAGDNPPPNGVPAGWAKMRMDQNGEVHIAWVDGGAGGNLYYVKTHSVGGINVYSYPNFYPFVNSTGSVAQFGFDRDGYLYFVSDAGAAGLASCETAADAGWGELIVLHIDNTNTAITPAVDCEDHPLTSTELASIIAFQDGVVGVDTALSTNYFHYLRGASLTNAALAPRTQNAFVGCSTAKIWENILSPPLYTGVEDRVFEGEGTQTVQCAPPTGLPSFAYSWLAGDPSTGTYSGDVIDPSSGTSLTTGTADTVPEMPFYMGSNNLVFQIGTPVPFATTGTADCVAGPLTNPAGGSCASYSLSAPYINGVYTWGNFPAKIKTDTNIISDGAAISYGWDPLWLGVAPNITAAFFGTTISTPYIVNAQTGTVNTTTLQVPFSTTLLPARGGNVDLGLSKVVNVWSPIGGACVSVGLFDGLMYDDGTLTTPLQINSRPAGTCLFNVLKTW